MSSTREQQVGPGRLDQVSRPEPGNEHRKVDATTVMTRSGEGAAMLEVAGSGPTERYSEVSASFLVQFRHASELRRARLYVHDPVHTRHAPGLWVPDDACGR